MPSASNKMFFKDQTKNAIITLFENMQPVDCLSHKILIDKLKCRGVVGMTFKCYLDGRTQLVKLT